MEYIVQSIDVTTIVFVILIICSLITGCASVTSSSPSMIRPSFQVVPPWNSLRCAPETLVTIRFERDGVPGVQSVTMPRSVVRVRDVKVAMLLGNPANGVGYIQLSGFAADTGSQVRQAIQYLQRAADAANPS